MSMVAERTIFPVKLNEEVIPAESPTVPNADTVSNTISMKDAFSVIDRIKTSSMISKMAMVQITNALSFILEEICLPNKSNSSFRDMTEIIDETDNPKVVVLTPPPVPPGEAPMYINIIIVVNPSVFIAPVSRVLKPVVVEADMAWNAEVKNRSFHDGKGYNKTYFPGILFRD